MKLAEEPIDLDHAWLGELHSELGNMRIAELEREPQTMRGANRRSRRLASLTWCRAAITA